MVTVLVAKSEIGQHFESISDLDMVIRLEPENSAAYNDRGADKACLGHYDAAIADFDAAIRINSEKRQMYTFNRGFCKKKLGPCCRRKSGFSESIKFSRENWRCGTYRPDKKTDEVASISIGAFTKHAYIRRS